MLTHTLTDTSVTILGNDFVPKTMSSEHPAFTEVVAALTAGNDNEVERLMDLPAAIVTFMQGSIQIVERTLYYKGRPLNTSLTTRILQFMEEGNAELAQPLIRFLEKVLENPSHRAVSGLYDWAVRSNLPITPDGDILAWKIVRPDYLDIHSRSFDNSVGQVVEQDRNLCDEDPDQTCSYGLHFCSTEYLPHFGGYSGSNHVMVVKLHPRDVVAFPRDYNISKGRACRYEVIGEVPPEKAKDFFPGVVSFADFSRSDDIDGDPDGELSDELEVGRFYRTRDGRIVEITEDRDRGAYPFWGAVLPSRSEEHTYGQFGSWNLYESHPLDLVELLPEDFDPDAETEVEQVIEEQPRRRSWLSQIFGG